MPDSCSSWGELTAPGADDHFLGGRGRTMASSPVHTSHAGAAQAAIGLALHHQARGLGAGPHLEVGAAIALGAQKGLGGVPAQAVFLVDLEIAHAFVAAAVEVVRWPECRLAARPARTHPGCPSAGAASRRAIRPCCRCSRSRRPGFCARRPSSRRQWLSWRRKAGSTLSPAPAVVAGQLGPLVVVAGLAAHVDHAVDAGAPPQRLAARVAQAAAVRARRRARSGRASRCGGCQCSADSPRGCGSSGSRPCGRLRSAARARCGRRSGGCKQGAGGAAADDDVVQSGCRSWACATGAKRGPPQREPGSKGLQPLWGTAPGCPIGKACSFFQGRCLCALCLQPVFDKYCSAALRRCSRWHRALPCQSA